jgi:hypothetical protein
MTLADREGPRDGQARGRRPVRWRVVGWGSLIASPFLMASLFNAALTNRSAGQVSAIESLPAEGTRELRFGQSEDCKPVVSKPVYIGQNTWIGQAAWQCEDPLSAP